MKKRSVYRTGLEVVKEIECHPKDFKAEVSKLEKEGFQIEGIETEAIKYKYKIRGFERRKNTEGEEWRDIPGEFFGLYQMSSLGRIRSIRVLEEYNFSVLTVSKNKRININVARMKKQIFGE